MLCEGCRKLRGSLGLVELFHHIPNNKPNDIPLLVSTPLSLVDLTIFTAPTLLYNPSFLSPKANCQMNIDRPNEIDAQRDSIHEAAAKRKRNDDAFHNDGEDEGAPVKIRRRQSDSESESSDELIGKVPLGGSDSDGKKSGLLSDPSKWRSAGVAETAKQHIPGRHSLSAAPTEDHLITEASIRRSLQSPDGLQRGGLMQQSGTGMLQLLGGAANNAEMSHRRKGPAFSHPHHDQHAAMRSHLGGDASAQGGSALEDESKTATDIYITGGASNAPTGEIEANGDAVAASRSNLVSQQLLAAAQSHQQTMASNPFGLLASQQQALGDQHMMRSILRNQASTAALLAGNSNSLGGGRASGVQDMGVQDLSHPSQMSNMLPGLQQLLMTPGAGNQHSFFPSSAAGAMAMQGRGLSGGMSAGLPGGMSAGLSGGTPAGMGGFDMNLLLQNSAHISSLYAARELQQMNPSIGTAQGLVLGGGGYLSQPPGAAPSTGAGFASNNHQHQQQQASSGGRAPIDLYMGCDDELLSDHQILLRKQIEYFEAGPQEVQSVTHGRRREIRVGQVGIRCKHCSAIPPRRRPKGAMYYPASLRALYQAAQNMAASHFTASCEMVGEPLKEQFRAFQSAKASAGHGGKKYWSDCAKAVGIVETEEGLRFKK